MIVESFHLPIFDRYYLRNGMDVVYYSTLPSASHFTPLNITDNAVILDGLPIIHPQPCTLLLKCRYGLPNHTLPRLMKHWSWLSITGVPKHCLQNQLSATSRPFFGEKSSSDLIHLNIEDEYKYWTTNLKHGLSDESMVPVTSLVMGIVFEGIFYGAHRPTTSFG